MSDAWTYDESGAAVLNLGRFRLHAWCDAQSFGWRFDFTPPYTGPFVIAAKRGECEGNTLESVQFGAIVECEALLVEVADRMKAVRIAPHRAYSLGDATD